jgi:hypothetical protein
MFCSDLPGEIKKICVYERERERERVGERGREKEIECV